MHNVLNGIIFIRAITTSRYSSPTTQEKTNWLTGTGNVDNTATPRRNIKTLLAAQLGVDEAEVILSADIVVDLGADSLDISELNNTFNTGFPRIDWGSYATVPGTFTSWNDFMTSYNLVDDICKIWADAENKSKVLVA